ncbi:sigma-70 family RNA polymerase sigma factor [Stenotrophomonas rhizophila]|uniref:sigma-70 family RNA polymerase sigma factor n=1 Tax=Stenotrophomonas rhizophila TaxID=216778 RepID=UPI0016429ECE|nr:sigma-70 family RNA polymerase sigma factor [Stenotrophomonas rhizophila]
MESPDSEGTMIGGESTAKDGGGRPSLKPLLRLAALRGDSQHVLRYLQLGGDVEACDQQGRTLHMLAASKGHLQLCELIEEHVLNVQHPARHEEPTEAAGAIVVWPGRDEIAGLDGAHIPSQHLELGVSVEAPCEADEFQSGFFGTWIVDVAADAPVQDPEIWSTVKKVHEEISRHVFVDKDEDWNELARLLPSHSEISLIRELNHSSTLHAFSGLIQRARNEGSFSPKEIEELSYEIEGVEDGDISHHLTVIMGQLGAVPEEDDQWLPPIHVYESSSSASDTDIEELELFMQDLASKTNDPGSHFWKITQGSLLLDRAGEERIGLLLDLSLKDAYRAIAESACAAASINRLADDFKHGRVSTGQISHLSVGDNVPLAEWTDGSGDPADEDEHPLPAAGPSLLALLETAASACSEWTGSPKDDSLGKRAMAAVSALELTSSTIRRIDQEFEGAGSVSLAMRRALGRLSRLEHEMFFANVKLAVHVADMYSWSTLPRMDRIQESLIGLLKAIDRFDYGRGTKFSTYAMWWLKQSLSRAIGDKARVIRLPIHVMERVSKIAKVARERGEDSAQAMRAQEIARLSDLSLNQVAKTLAVIDDAVSWDQEDGVQELASSTQDTSSSPEEWTDEFLRRRAIDECLAQLPPREAEVVRHRFGLINGEDRTLEEVGQMFGVTRERIRQIEAKALRKMRHPKRRLGELVNGIAEKDDAAEQ